jgi:cell division protein FtsL
MNYNITFNYNVNLIKQRSNDIKIHKYVITCLKLHFLMNSIILVLMKTLNYLTASNIDTANKTISKSKLSILFDNGK